jgi:hypothetical protein
MQPSIERYLIITSKIITAPHKLPTRTDMSTDKRV